MGRLEVEGRLCTLRVEGIRCRMVGVTLDSDVRDDEACASSDDEGLSKLIEKAEARVDESMEEVSSIGGLRGTGRKK